MKGSIGVLLGSLLFLQMAHAAGDAVAINIGGPEEEYQGQIDRPAVRSLMRNLAPQIKECYVGSANKSGKVILSLEVETDGKVKRPVIKTSTLGDSKVQDCLVGLIARQTFPKLPPELVARVYFPITFKAQP